MIFSDFYAGAGGWNLGLLLAGHEAAMSAEIWKPANRTRSWNFGRDEECVDVRALNPASVPDCELIVGSPPCTQFSFANRGGNGDIEDGLQDVRAFLRIVEQKRPRYWVMENVPRLSGILEKELAEGGSLREFAHLFDHVDNFDMSDWGVPQRRQRCIAGRYPLEALLALRGRKAPTLAEVLQGCAAGIDPVWGQAVNTVTDNIPGPSLTWEEARINKEKKQNHPIYNDMAFPDRPDRTARTVTATCTKVSRESIVVPDGVGGYRLLSVRETAAVQSFPLSYQFVSKGRGDRIKMAGNAIPPLFTYFIGLAVAGRPAPDSLPEFTPASGAAQNGVSEREGHRPHRSGRTFRAAIAALRFKSGMSFELNNSSGYWKVVFNAGGPGKSKVADPDAIATAVAGIAPASATFMEQCAVRIQAAWERSEDCADHPFRVADRIGDAAMFPVDAAKAVGVVTRLYESLALPVPDKALRNAPAITAGLLVADGFNRWISVEGKAAAA